MPTTIKDIAARTGFSVPTVKQVLGSRAMQYQPETRRLIQEAALELGYRPNASARATATGKHGGLAVIFPDDEFYGSIFHKSLRQILFTAESRDKRVTLARLPDTKLTDAAFMTQALPRLSADGLIINYIQHAPDQLLEILRTFRIPAVWTNARLDADCLYPDDFSASRDVTNRLIALGHRRIVYVDQFRSEHYSGVDRPGGYRAAIEAAGLEPIVIVGPQAGTGVSLFPGEWVDFTIANLPKHPGVTAAVCYSKDHAIATYVSALSLGLQVPRDLSIVCFDEATPAFSVIPLATSLIPAAEIGRQAVEMVLEKIADESLVFPPRAIAHGFDAGHTLAPPRGA